MLLQQRCHDLLDDWNDMKTKIKVPWRRLDPLLIASACWEAAYV